jgi:pyruvate carboxylase subunit A
MQRALYEYVILGVASNIPFHQAVMENPRFRAGELETGFIDREVSLSAATRRIAETGGRLQEKFPRQAENKKRVVAMAVAAALSGMLEPKR